MNFKTLLLSCAFALLSVCSALATHNLGGEIEFRQLGPLEIEADVITYTNINGSSRDTLTICWGDGLCERIARVNGPDDDGNGVPDGEVISSLIRMSVYRYTHTYDEAGVYIISMTDPNRNSGILNINFPNSENVKFHIESQVEVGTSGPSNTSPDILEPPTGIGIVGKPFMHVPNAFDIDDDSIAYSLAIPFQDNGEEVPNYVFPDMINPGPNNQLTLDAVTGALVWDAPQRAGEYVISIKVTTYSDGIEQDIVYRDLTILVIEAEHLPPEITCTETQTEIIPVAIGDTIFVGATASSLNDTVAMELTSSCGLYEGEYFQQTASFSSTTNGNQAQGSYQWIVEEEHLREQAYQFVFRAQDNFQEEGSPWYKVLRYRVVTSVNTEQRPEPDVHLGVFPNPVQDILHVQLKGSTKPSRYTLYSATGKVVLSGMLKDNASLLDLAHLPGGTYFLNAQIAGRTTTARIIKQ